MCTLVVVTRHVSGSSSGNEAMSQTNLCAANVTAHATQTSVWLVA